MVDDQREPIIQGALADWLKATMIPEMRQVLFDEIRAKIERGDIADALADLKILEDSVHDTENHFLRLAERSAIRYNPLTPQGRERQERATNRLIQLALEQARAEAPEGEVINLSLIDSILRKLLGRKK